jgi:hypothetical protein
MKTLTILVLFIFCSSYGHLRKIDPVHYAINQVSTEYFATNSPKVDLHVFGGTRGNEKVLDYLLKHKSPSISYQVFKRISPKASQIQLQSPSILFFESRETFEQNYNRIVWQQNRGVRNKHLVYYPNATSSDFDFINNGYHIDQVNFIVTDNTTSIELATSFMFSPTACKTIQFTTINTFDESKLKWNCRNFYPRKYRNFHGCELSTFHDEKSKTGAFQIISSFARFANFKLKIYEKWNSSSDEMKRLDFDLQVGTVTNSNQNNQFSYPFLFDHMTFLIPPGELYSPIERILLKLDVKFLIAFGVFLVFSFLLAFLIELLSDKVRGFLFDTTSPAINLLATFLVGVQPQVPARTFARFFLTLFIFWSMIATTCFQSELYDFLQSETRKPQVKTIAELIERNFTFYKADFLVDTVNKIADERGLKR